jgi:hypothetical protein
LIERAAFWRCSSLSSICLPPALQGLGHAAFSRATLRAISVSEGNRHFKVIGDFLLDFECISITKYFGSGGIVTIPKTIEQLDTECFFGSETISNVIFESGSVLCSIEAAAFWLCSSLSSICIPSSVETLGKRCFYE